jgi:hypothetical protein
LFWVGSENPAPDDEASVEMLSIPPKVLTGINPGLADETDVWLSVSLLASTTQEKPVER